ncbi:hypothetical protein BCR35DRAFT_352803 [Leucosporidium creatinivorum]|uniref:F-box domain-containing protein n=1 Tax=Leucosporidium creatinivorum TaxID=106004 RepID=A0A1Y2F4K0_9BASI|nr:hypothetical protein BCR35DRAFT_352803 [Leucosporidium creatinivorum]
MAVIQDLPPELLRRVLELLSNSYYPRPARNLPNTSLVARAWTRPSQDLLISAVVFNRSDTPRYTKRLRSVSTRTLDRADLDYNSAQKVLELLTEAKATVRSLNIVGAKGQDLDLGIMSFKMLAGLHSLHLEGYFKGQPPIPSDATIELKALTLDFDYLPPPAFLDSLIGAAPFLTRLELYTRAMGQFPEGYSTALPVLALQLHHLSIRADATSTPTHPRKVDLHGFVASCTSLRSLELDYATPASITATLTAVRSPLLLLETEMKQWSEVADERGMADLVDVLKHPSLAQLKRWRIFGYPRSSHPLPKDARTHWEDACRARGVEPRDKRRFFTDYPAEDVDVLDGE